MSLARREAQLWRAVGGPPTRVSRRAFSSLHAQEQDLWNAFGRADHQRIIEEHAEHMANPNPPFNPYETAVHGIADNSVGGRVTRTIGNAGRNAASSVRSTYQQGLTSAEERGVPQLITNRLRAIDPIDTAIGVADHAVNNQINKVVNAGAQKAVGSFLKTQAPIRNPTYSDNAILSKAAYSNGRGRAISGFEIDSELSGSDFTTYRNLTTGKATISYRGTDVTNFGDLKQDFHVALGNMGQQDRTKQAIDVANRAIQKYGKGNVNATGFSLGGTTAAYVSSSTGIPAETFNMGWSPEMVSAQTRGKRYGVVMPWTHRDGPLNLKNVTANINSNDLISNSALALPKGTFGRLNVDREPGRREAKTHLANFVAETAVGVGEGLLTGLGGGRVTAIASADEMRQAAGEVGKAFKGTHSMDNWSNERISQIEVNQKAKDVKSLISSVKNSKPTPSQSIPLAPPAQTTAAQSTPAPAPEKQKNQGPTQTSDVQNLLQGLHHLSLP